ncbi:MAG: hypothetical protein KGJ57_03410 [Sphingomonadales bacterium]|nr:hypothetical protein [Sphingomonadales bacterium]MDE2168457.1 hypothetical protein [Sphingomonadales bacterium]
MKKLSLGAALTVSAAGALVATPASAQPWHGGYGRGNDAGVAIAAGVVGLALGAALADQGPYYGDAQPVGYAPYPGPAGCFDAYPGYDDDCYPADYYYRLGWSWRDGYWWNGGQRYARPFVGRGAPVGLGFGGGFRGGDYGHGGYDRGGYARGDYGHGGYGQGGYGSGGYASGSGRGDMNGGSFGGGHGGGFGGGHGGGHR